MVQHADLDHSGVTGAGIPATTVDAKGDLLAGTAADTVGRLAVGANDTILMADSGQSTGLKWVAAGTPTDQDYDDVASAGTADTFARGDHLHGMPSAGGGAPTASEARLSGDTTMTNAAQWYDGPSLSLAAGKWLVQGKLLLQCNHASASGLIGRIYDGTSSYDATEWDYQGGNAGQSSTVPLMAVITLGGTTTVKLQGQDVARAGSKILATGSTGLTNLATVITAVAVS